MWCNGTLRCSTSENSTQGFELPNSSIFSLTALSRTRTKDISPAIQLFPNNCLQIERHLLIYKPEASQFETRLLIQVHDHDNYCSARLSGPSHNL